MRVISGTAGGRRLTEPRGSGIRPTSDMVKESVFNIVQFDIEGRRVLDLFAGTGQIGIEALSRGARSVVFVDSGAESVKLISKNLELCGFSDAATVYNYDVVRYLEEKRHKETFDLIFLDPPYDTHLAGEILTKIIEFDKLNANGIIICETKAGSARPVVSPPYYFHKEYRYGGVNITRFGRGI